MNYFLIMVQTVEKVNDHFTFSNITTIIASLIALLSAIYSVSLKNKIESYNRQDEQTKWVNRLLDVAVKTNNDFGQHEILQIISCLRPTPTGNSYKIEDNQAEWNHFSDTSLKYCHSLLDHTEFTIQEMNNCRLIANTLLKTHWEYMSFKNHKSFYKLLKSIFSYFLPCINDNFLSSSKISKLKFIYADVVVNLDEDLINKNKESSKKTKNISKNKQYNGLYQKIRNGGK